MSKECQNDAKTITLKISNSINKQVVKMCPLKRYKSFLLVKNNTLICGYVFLHLFDFLVSF